MGITLPVDTQRLTFIFVSVCVHHTALLCKSCISLFVPSWGISSSPGSAVGGYWDFLPPHWSVLDSGWVFSQGLTGLLGFAGVLARQSRRTLCWLVLGPTNIWNVGMQKCKKNHWIISARAINLDMVLKNLGFVCGEQGYTGTMRITNMSNSAFMFNRSAECHGSSSITQPCSRAAWHVEDAFFAFHISWLCAYVQQWLDFFPLY